MRKVQKGFTLVELIVVITILAILATIAFISLQGYSQDAKNSKVNADIRTLASAVETSLSDGTVSSMSNIVLGDLSATVGVGQTTSGNFDATGSLFGPNNVDMSGSTYDVGTMNFVGLRQNGDDFKDNNGHDYLVATAVNGSNDAYYQIAGQTTNADGTFTAVVKGNYIQGTGTGNIAGLLSQSGALAWTGGVSNGETMSSGFYVGL